MTCRNDVITIVTGLPRSGTSLVMQMLAAGGCPLLLDGKRAADEDNPRGYLEFEPVKAIARDHAWLAEARGKAVKIVAPLLGHLSDEHTYQAIWIDRPIEEVMTSQSKMLERKMLERAGRAPGAEDAALRRAFEKQLATARSDLERRGAAILDLSYPKTVADPSRAAREIAAFLRIDFDVQAAAASVDPTLHRNRSR